MRTNEFVFKKTTKRVVKHRGLSVDLTEQDAAQLLVLLGQVNSAPCRKPGDLPADPGSEFYAKLFDALDAFLVKSSVVSDVKVYWDNAHESMRVSKLVG